MKHLHVTLLLGALVLAPSLNGCILTIQNDILPATHAIVVSGDRMSAAEIRSGASIEFGSKKVMAKVRVYLAEVDKKTAQPIMNRFACYGTIKQHTCSGSKDNVKLSLKDAFSKAPTQQFNQFFKVSPCQVLNPPQGGKPGEEE